MIYPLLPAFVTGVLGGGAGALGGCRGRGGGGCYSAGAGGLGGCPPKALCRAWVSWRWGGGGWDWSGARGGERAGGGPPPFSPPLPAVARLLRSSPFAFSTSS